MKKPLYVLLVAILSISACAPSVGDKVVAKDTAHLLVEFGQFSMSDPRAKPCVVDNSQVFNVEGSGYNDLWEIDYIEVSNVRCADGRTLPTAYGATSQFRMYEQ